MRKRVSSVLAALVCMGVIAGSGCGKKGDGGKAQELASQLDQCSNDLKAAQGKLDSCTTSLASTTNTQDLSTVTVNVEGDVLTLVARKTGTGGSKPPPEITSEEAQKVYAAAVKVIRDNRSALQVCYDRALKQDNSLANQTIKAELLFTVHPDGKVTSPSVTPKIGKSFNECVSSSMSNWRFTGLPGKPMKVSAAVTLTSSDK